MSSKKVENGITEVALNRNFKVSVVTNYLFSADEKHLGKALSHFDELWEFIMEQYEIFH